MSNLFLKCLFWIVLLFFFSTLIFLENHLGPMFFECFLMISLTTGTIGDDKLSQSVRTRNL